MPTGNDGLHMGTFPALTSFKGHLKQNPKELKAKYVNNFNAKVRSLGQYTESAPF